MKACCETNEGYYGRDLVQNEEGSDVGDWCVAERDYYSSKKARESGFEAFNPGSLRCWLDGAAT